VRGSEKDEENEGRSRMRNDDESKCPEEDRGRGVKREEEG